jgi:hypothetical protein
MTVLEIRSAGRPPERHADRVIGQMLGHLAKQVAHLPDTIRAVVHDSKDGGPRAQRRMVNRLEEAGKVSGRKVIIAMLRPGKRGKYALRLVFWTGWDPARDCEIGPGDPVPDKPWVVLWVAIVTSEGNGRERVAWKRYPLIFVSHHLLSRAAQRLGVRTLGQLQTMIGNVAAAGLKLVTDKDDLDVVLKPPPAGWRIRLGDDATVVLQRYGEKTALLAVTVLD